MKLVENAIRYPVSVTVVSAQIAGELETRPVKYMQSHQNDPLGAAVAREVVRVIRDEGLIERGREIGAALIEPMAVHGLGDPMHGDLGGQTAELGAVLVHVAGTLPPPEPPNRDSGPGSKNRADQCKRGGPKPSPGSNGETVTGWWPATLLRPLPVAGSPIPARWTVPS